MEFWKLGVVYFCTVTTFFQFSKIRGGRWRTTKQLFFSALVRFTQLKKIQRVWSRFDDIVILVWDQLKINISYMYMANYSVFELYLHDKHLRPLPANFSIFTCLTLYSLKLDLWPFLQSFTIKQRSHSRKSIVHLKGVLHPWPILWLFMHFSQK